MFYGQAEIEAKKLAFYDADDNPIIDVISCDTETGKVRRKVTMHDGLSPVGTPGVDGTATFDYPPPILVVAVKP